MGLMDMLSGTPDDLQGQQALGLASGLLSARGGPALAAGIQNMQAARKDWQDRQIEQMKMNMLMAQFPQQLRQMQLGNQVLAQGLGGGQDSIGAVGSGGTSPVPTQSQGNSAPSAPAASMPSGGVQAQPNAAPAQGRTMFGLPMNAAAGGILAGMPGMQELGKAIVAANQVPEEVRVANALGIPLDQVRAAKQREMDAKGVTVSASGQASAVGRDAQGNPVVFAPQGALQTYQQYKNADMAAAAQNDLVTVNLPGRGPVQMTKAQALQLSGGGQAPAQSGAPSAAPSAPSMSQAPGVDGLDVSRLSPQQMSFLRQQDPQAFANGMEHFINSGGVPGAQPSGAASASANNAPASGPGIQLQTPEELAARQKAVDLQFSPQQAYANAAANNLADKGKALSSQVAESQELLKRIDQSRQALQTFQAGGGMGQRADVAKALQGLGAPASVVDQVAGGSLSGVQQFQKYAAQEAIQTMRQALANDDGKGSPGNKAAMQVFFQQNPNIDTDPRAIEKIFNFQTQLHNQMLDQQDKYVQYVSNPQNPKDIAAFDNYWAHQAINKGYVNPQIVSGQALGSMPFSATVKLPSGGSKTYTFPDAKSLANFKLEAGIK